VHGIGFLKEKFSEEITEFLQYLIALITDSIQEAACASTLQDNTLTRGCFTSSRLVWHPWITLSFSLVQLVDCLVEVALLEDKQYLEGRTVKSPFSDSLIMQLELLQEV